MTPPRPPKDEEEKRGTQVALRLTKDELARLDGLALMMREATGIEVTRSAAIRSSMVAGLEVLEARFATNKKTKR